MPPVLGATGTVRILAHNIFFLMRNGGKGRGGAVDPGDIQAHKPGGASRFPLSLKTDGVFCRLGCTVLYGWDLCRLGCTVPYGWDLCKDPILTNQE